ncbi:MAG: sugar kinase [Pseudomonadota bacterium]
MSIFVLGEGMLELAAIEDGSARVAYGGDALNTAVHLARLGAAPQFVTALGDDPYSDWLAGKWRAEGVGLDHCLRIHGGKPGIYAISIGDDGERSFTYWRNDSAARAFFSHPMAESAIAAMMGASLLYLTGITLSIFDVAHRERIFEIMDFVRSRGGEVAFDVNYRPKGWLRADDARSAIRSALERSSIAFSSVEDWALLFETSDAEGIATLVKKAAGGEVIVKDGVRGCFFAAGEDRGWVAPKERCAPVDTTGAGDSFNAAYLAARIAGRSPQEACATGNSLAAKTIMHTGAIGARVAH